MSDIQAVFENINDIEATIAEIGRSMEAEPMSPAAKLMVQSLERRRDELKEMAEELAAERLVDVCDYAILPTELNRYPIKEVGQSLSGWQDTITAFFVPVREGKPRQRANYSDELQAQSTLNFAFSYQGSLGVVMYALNDQLLEADSDLDQAVAAIMSLVDTETVADVRQLADRFGKAAIKSFFDWSKIHTDADLSANIKWKRGKEVRFERTVQPRDLERVQGIIKIADARDDKTDTYEGVLVALNVTGQGFFKIVFADPNERDASGKFDESFDSQTKHPVPARYRATLRKIIYTSLWSSDERIEWELIDLEELPSEII